MKAKTLSILLLSLTAMSANASDLIDFSTDQVIVTGNDLTSSTVLKFEEMDNYGTYGIAAYQAGLPGQDDKSLGYPVSKITEACLPESKQKSNVSYYCKETETLSVNLYFESSLMGDSKHVRMELSLSEGTGTTRVSTDSGFMGRSVQNIEVECKITSRTK